MFMKVFLAVATSLFLLVDPGHAAPGHAVDELEEGRTFTGQSAAPVPTKRDFQNLMDTLILDGHRADQAIRAINLDRYPMTLQDAEELGRTLQGSVAVQALYLCRTNLGDQGVKALFGGFTDHNIDHLDLSYANLRAGSIPTLAAWLRRASHLRGLFLNGNSLEPDHVDEICAALTDGPLIMLRLSKCGLKSRGVQVLVKHLPKMSRLEELGLGSNDLNDSAASSLAGVWAQCPSLTDLYLGDNPAITPRGTLALIESTDGKGGQRKIDLREGSLVGRDPFAPQCLQRKVTLVLSDAPSSVPGQM